MIDSRHADPIGPNRLWQRFVAVRWNQVWLSDPTHIPTGKGRLFLAAIIDQATREMVGWTMRQMLRAGRGSRPTRS